MPPHGKTTSAPFSAALLEMANALRVKEELLAAMDQPGAGTVGEMMAAACDAAEPDTLQSADFSQLRALQGPSSPGPQ